MPDITPVHSRPTSWPAGRLSRATAWTAFTIALGFSLLVLVETNYTAIPFLVHDEWVVSTKIVSLSFLEAMLAGHNGVPSYVQNASWWLDYRWLDYQGVLPLGVHIVCLATGFAALFAVTVRSGFSGAAAALSAFVWLCLWISMDNMPQYSGIYRWRAVSASSSFALIGLCLLITESAWRRTLAGEQAYFQLAALVVLAWCGLFLNGGMVLLPIFLLVAALSPAGRRYWPAAAVILAAFSAHFLQLYDLDSAPGGGEQGWRELLGGCVYLLTSVPYLMLLEFSAGLAQAVSATLVCAGLGATSYLGGKLLLRRLNVREMVALVLLLYPLWVTLIIAYVRIAERGATFALAGRYRNYSIYLIIGLVLLSLDILSRSRARLAVRAAAGFLSLCLGLAGLGLLRTAANFPALSNELQATAAAVIPYSFMDGALPPIRGHTPRRASHAQEYHDVLLSRRSSVFGSPEYQAYASALSTGLLADSQQSCFDNLLVAKSYVFEESVLVYLSAELGGYQPAQEGFVIFTDLHGRPAGWGFRHQSLSRRLRDLLAGEESSELVLGWALLETGSPSVRAALVDGNNSVLCASTPASAGERKGAVG